MTPGARSARTVRLFYFGGIVMKKGFDYQRYFGKALEMIKAIRDPYATRHADVEFGWDKVLQKQIVNIGAADFRRPTDVIDSASDISIVCIYNILIGLIAERAKYCRVLALPADTKVAAKRPFIAIDTKANRLIVVKNIEQDIALITEKYIPEDITQLMQKTGTTTYAQVYLVHESADLQFIGPNNDLSKTAHGKNVHSFPWLFDTYFGEGEYSLFTDALTQYNSAVDEYLGYSVVRSLNPTALVNFKKITERSIRTFNYDQIMSKTITNKFGKNTWLNHIREVNKLKKQFLSDGVCKLLLAGNDYAESLTTAEWLFDSMKKAHAIDLTVIGTGYFKAAEQMLYALIKLYNPSFDPKSTLGDCATFYKDNHDIILRSDVHWSTRDFIFEAIYEYADLRNGYFHKHNIHDPAKILEIRSATYTLMFLLLGGQKLSNSDLVSLGLTALTGDSDFELLCDYIQYHKNSLFCVAPDDYPEQWIRIVPRTEVPQSVRDTEKGPCIYFNVLGANNCGRFFAEDVPKRIWAGKISISHTTKVELAYEKTLLIFEGGKYVGPVVADAEDFTY